MGKLCLSCKTVIPGDFKELALHISHEKKGHRKGKIWAARYLTKVKYLDQKVSGQNRERTPMTEEQKETKASLVRELSGEYAAVLTVCPHCKKGHQETIEKEYAESETAWRSESGKPMVLCSRCRMVR